MADRDCEIMNRRRFLLWLGGGLLMAGAAALGCSLRRTPILPAPGETVVPGTWPAWRWEVRWIGGPPPVDRGTWRLEFDGLIRTPRELTLDQLHGLPATSLRLRMKCVECWSAPAVWSGVAGRDLLAVVQPLPEARYVTLQAIDGYTSTLSIEELTADRVVFAYGMDGRELPIEHGYPLRLIAPSKCGYKCVKGITRLEFVDRRVPGFWERLGYDNVGTVQPGLDHPLDLGRTARQIDGGEITEY